MSLEFWVMPAAVAGVPILLFGRRIVRGLDTLRAVAFVPMSYVPALGRRA